MISNPKNVREKLLKMISDRSVTFVAGNLTRVNVCNNNLCVCI